MTKTIQQIENNLQTDHLKSLPNIEQENEEENKVFDLVLVDIWKTYDCNEIKCVKKNMYDPELKYICISYRWGELNEQQLETPDYTAHITSFLLWDLVRLCEKMKDEPDFKKINYLWIDAISVDQQNHARKKDTILKMNQIYKYASYILAIPDLHLEYLRKNTANNEIIGLIEDKYDETIYNEIFNNEQLGNDSRNYDDDEISISTHSISQGDFTSEQLINNNDQYSSIQKSTNELLLKKMEELKTEIKELKMRLKEKEMENEELKTKNIKEEKRKIYSFLAYLIDDWSNRAWVISEYQIAKDKYMKHGTPLKYMFYSLLSVSFNNPFFSYHFNEDDDQQSTMNNNKLKYQEVEDHILFNQFVKSRFMQRSHLDMMLSSNATRNEDRFNAILLSWNKYNHIIKNKSTISNWNITDMASVRLKLYEIMDDLWDKASLLHACKEGNILPTFASNYVMDDLNIIEKMDYNSDRYKQFEVLLLTTIEIFVDKDEAVKIKQLMNEYKMNFKPIWNENLTSIQFDKHHCYLSVKSKNYMILTPKSYEVEGCRSKLSLDDDDEIHSVFIPFFTSNLPGYIEYLNIYTDSSYVYIIGNMDKNKWLVHYDDLSNYKSEHFCTDDYTFTIY